MSSVRVRMYRQGLGDCFLLTFPSYEAQESSSHVLIDCGVLTGTENAGDKMQRVTQDIFDTTGGKLDVLVATHEHWDHVSGFLQAEQRFDELEVGEVWLAWTENPDDEEAQNLTKRKSELLQGIVSAQQHLEAFEDPNVHSRAKRLQSLLEFSVDFSVEGRKTTAKAMDWVRNRGNPRPKYCKPGEDPLEVPRVRGVRVYVLGPPLERQQIRTGKISDVYELSINGAVDRGFLDAVQSLDEGATANEQPFERWFRMSESQAKEEDFFKAGYWAESEDWRTIEHSWLEMADSLALKLDSYTNNTSLVLAFELCDSGRVLLFPGDAQVGSWESWDGLEWQINEGDMPRTVTTADLLARTVLYKVGHHGSHNATLREKGLEMMNSDELVALIPVNRHTAEKRKWKMPFPSLYMRLQEKTKGRILDMDLGVQADKPEAISEDDWRRFTETKTLVTDEWVDYFIEM